MEILETYIKQIGRYPLLNAEQEKKLSEQIEKGSAQAAAQADSVFAVNEQEHI